MHRQKRYRLGHRMPNMSGGRFEHRSWREAKTISRSSSRMHSVGLSVNLADMAQYLKPCLSWTANSRRLICGCGLLHSMRARTVRSGRGKSSNSLGGDVFNNVSSIYVIFQLCVLCIQGVDTRNLSQASLLSDNTVVVFCRRFLIVSSRTLRLKARVCSARPTSS